MYNLQARAFQTRSGIFVRVAGLLENGCMRAKITGTYPGSVVHIVDPGFAEVFISEWRRPGEDFCTMGLVPWSDTVLIHDFEHKQVHIYVNHQDKLTVNVEGLPTRNFIDADWIVTALTGSPKDGPYFGCSIHHKDDIILGIYSRVFGPASRADCEAFIKKHCNIFE